MAGPYSVQLRILAAAAARRPPKYRNVAVPDCAAFGREGSSRGLDEAFATGLLRGSIVPRQSIRKCLSVGGLTAGQCYRDMPHGRIGFGAMPVALTGPDMDDIADIDLALFVLCCHHPGA
jgi:hypothetical protein